MRKRQVFGDRVITSALVLLLSGGTNVTNASAGQSDPLLRDIAVCVRDFELSVAPGASPEPPNLAYGNKRTEDVELRSRQVQDYFAETLVETLRKQGYSPSRNQTLSETGILLEGVFAEPDQKNRIRRALLGSESPGTKFTLYVGAFDRKSANEPLYMEAPLQEPDPNYGPVITLNSYIPMAKYEIEKGIAEEDVRRICKQIVSDLTVLLQRNRTALRRQGKPPRYTFLRSAEGAKSPFDTYRSVTL